MKILLGNNSLSFLGGSETWTYTLAKALRDLGHHVACYSPELGIISAELEKEGIHSYTGIEREGGIKVFTPYFTEPIDHGYDVIIANHWHIVQALRERFPKTPIISTIHGIIHSLENNERAPEHPALEAGVQQFVAVSEEVKAMLREQYQIDAALIHNFFDIPKFAAVKAPKEKPEMFLINTNYAERNDPVVQAVRDASKHFGARVAAIGVGFTPTFDVLKAIEDSDVVFGMGRSVLEGVAAGRLGIVHGRWGTGGPIVESNVEAVRFHNFSGRNSQGAFASVEELIKMIEEHYTPHNLEWGKHYVKREHNSVVAAETYVRLARELTGATINDPVDANEGVAADAKPFKRAGV